MADKYGVTPADLHGAPKSASEHQDTEISRAAEGDLVHKFARVPTDLQAAADKSSTSSNVQGS